MVLSAQPVLSSPTVPHLKPQISAGDGFQETPSVWGGGEGTRPTEELGFTRPHGEGQHPMQVMLDTLEF